MKSSNTTDFLKSSSAHHRGADSTCSNLALASPHISERSATSLENWGKAGLKRWSDMLTLSSHQVAEPQLVFRPFKVQISLSLHSLEAHTLHMLGTVSLPASKHRQRQPRRLWTEPRPTLPYRSPEGGRIPEAGLNCSRRIKNLFGKARGRALWRHFLRKLGLGCCFQCPTPLTLGSPTASGRQQWRALLLRSDYIKG